jgi:3-hydroxyacyl-CoA dehydrogenase
VVAIEIMGHSNTDPAVVDLMMERCGEHGFEPFRVKQDSMGYIYNR